MGIQLFQEQAPFSNKRIDRPISTDGVFTNPVIAPFSFDFTTHVNTLECVVYLKNNSQEHYYKNVIISLMKEGELASSPVDGNIVNDSVVGPALSINGHVVPTGFTTETIPTIPADPGIVIAGSYDANYTPVYDFERITRKLVNDYWVASLNVDWDDVGELFIKDPAGPAELVVGGSWNYGFRPTKIALNFTTPGDRTWSLFDAGGNEIATAVSLGNGMPIPITYVEGGGDIYKFIFYDTSGSIMDIIFLDAQDNEIGRGNASTTTSSDNNLSVKFSYGYDEINEPEWDNSKSVLVIPSLGTTNIPDTSYHPIRMRIIWKSRSPLVTIRDYFIDISYEAETSLGV
jgi:hypothetical protein